MPVEVADWIKQAESRITYLTTEVGRLKEENQSLRRANKVMESRVMGASRE
jgi:FtsZ-binding cell division protein ZapB